MKARPLVVYSVLRLLAFLVPFGLLMLLPIGREFYWLSAIFAALIGLSLSMIFLRRPLDEATSGLAERRAAARAAASDEAAEDAAAESLTPQRESASPAPDVHDRAASRDEPDERRGSA